MALQSEAGEQRASWGTLITTIIVAALPSLVLLAVLPPVYSDMTIVGIVHNPAAAMPHYPPLYGYFVWSVHQVAHMFGAPAGASDAGLMLMALIQQAVLVAAIVYFAIGCSATLLGRVLAIAPFYVLLQFAIINLGLQTEALWLSSLIFLFGAGIRIVRTGSLTWWTAAALFLSFTMTLLLRPTGLFFAPIIPGALLLVALIERHRRPAIAAALSLLILGAAFVTSNLVFRGAMAANNMEYVSPWGRGTIEVLQRVIWRMEDGDGLPKADRAALIPRLQQKAWNERLREAVPTLVTYLDRTYDGTAVAGVWGGAHTALLRAGLVRTVTEADRLVNDFCLLFIRSFPRLLVAQVQDSLRRFRGTLLREEGYNSSNLSLAITGRQLAVNLARDQPTLGSPDLDNLAMRKQHVAYLAANKRFETHPHIAFLAETLSGIHLMLALAIPIALSVGATTLDRRDAAFAFAALSVTAIYVLMSSILLVFNWRYLLPIELVLGVLIGLVLSRILSPSTQVTPSKSSVLTIPT